MLPTEMYTDSPELSDEVLSLEGGRERRGIEGCTKGRVRAPADRR